MTRVTIFMKCFFLFELVFKLGVFNDRIQARNEIYNLTKNYIDVM